MDVGADRICNSTDDTTHPIHDGYGAFGSVYTRVPTGTQ